MDENITNKNEEQETNIKNTGFTNTNANNSNISNLDQEPVTTSPNPNPYSITNAVIPSSSKKVDKNKDKDEGKDEGKDKQPNSIIIYLETNMTNSSFTPKMLVPSVNSDTVFVDTSFEYTKEGIKEIPEEAPKETILTQFFLANQFQLMKKRTLSNFFDMQKKLSYKEAKAEGIIDNNLDLTMQTLFKENNVIYIGSKPYTIIKRKYRKGNWETDIKPSEQLVGTSSDTEKIEKEAKNELKELGEDDESLLYGSASARGKKAKNELKQKIQEQKELEQQQQELEKGQKGQTVRPSRAFIQNIQKLEKMPAFLDYLLGGDLEKNDPINFEAIKERMNPCEPITFSLVIGLTDDAFVNYITGNDETDTGINLYNKYVEAKDKLLKANQSFFDIISEQLSSILDEYNDLKQQIQDDVEDKENGSNVDLKQTKQRILGLEEQKQKYMKSIMLLSQTLIEVFNLQRPYFECIIALLEYIKINYVKMIGYKKTQRALLADKCIDYDLQVFNSLVTSSSVNENSSLEKCRQIYDSNITAYNGKHSTWFSEPDLPTVNTANELAKYQNNWRIMYIEKKQYEIYMLIIMLHCFTNQADIWKIYFEMLPDFIKSFADETRTKLANLQIELTNYNIFLTKLKDDKKPVLDDKDMLTKFNTMMTDNSQDNTDGSNYNLYSMSKKDSFLSKKNPVTEQEKRFINLKEKEVDVYQYIILFTHLLELRCLRQHFVYISELNIFTLQKEIAITFDYYYKSIERSIDDGKVFIVPKSLMWSTEELSDQANQNNTDFIRTKINSNELTERLYEQKCELVEESISSLKDYCETIHGLIEPVMDIDGITNVCKMFQMPTGSGSSLVVNLLEFPAYETRLWRWASIQDSNIDIELTEAFNAQMARIYKWSKNMKEEGEEDNYNEDWIILNNFPNNTDVDNLLKELTSNSDESKIERVKALLRCELIIFEMSSDNNGELNYDYNKGNKGMTGGAGFSDYDNIEKAFKISDTSCAILKSSYNKDSKDVDGNPVKFLFLVKVAYNTNKQNSATSYSYKLVYNNNAKYKATQNYLYSYDDIHNNISYIDFYIEYKCVKEPSVTELVTKTEGEERVEEAKEEQKEKIEEVKEEKGIAEEKTSIIKTGTGLKLSAEDIMKISDIGQLNKKKKSINKSLASRQSELTSPLTVLSEKRKTQLESEIVIFENQLQTVDQRIQELQGQKGGGQYGGGPRDRYYSTQGIQELQENQLNNPNYGQPSSMFQQPYLQQPVYPYSYGQQPIYPSVNSTMNPSYTTNPSYTKPYSQQSMINPLQQHTYAKQMTYLNKALELESKLAFYVNVELVLFPGASVSPSQKASALCGSRFEDIRKAITELFGLEYYQKPIDDAYIYQSGKSNKNEENEENEENEDKSEKTKKGGSIKKLKLKKSISKKRRNNK